MIMNMVAGSSSNGLYPTLTVYVETGATVVATDGTNTLTGTSASGQCVFSEVPAFGTWTVTATKGSSSATGTITLVQDYTITLSFGAIVNVTLTRDGSAQSGETVTAACSGQTSKTQTTDSSGKCTFSGLAAGTWTFSTSNASYICSSAAVTCAVGSTYSVSLTQSSVSSTLGNNSWATIKSVAEAGLASTYWAVGAYKDDTISGTVGVTSISGTYRFYIVGFNHNSSVEGSNTISFMIKNTSGTDIAFIDSKYNTAVSTTNYFSMNSSAINTGGWKSSQMRANICGGATDVTTGSNTLLARLSSALQAVIAKSKIYSDNTGGGSDTASYVTATYDKIYLASEFEVQGVRTSANSAEENYQKQFQYYINGNSKLRYRHSATTSTAYWWCRSVHSSNSSYFCRVAAGGSTGNPYAYYSYGFAPCFKIGADAA